MRGATEQKIKDAIRDSHLDVAQVLLDHGVDLKVKNKKDEMPRTLKSKGGKDAIGVGLGERR